ncbi:sulfatase family protein [Pontiella sulfatireligans]|uniref:Choline-sulfatase n=1 Tax=Pontiella sulfatireligans TaxID=2750658 RepID=A0A6C2UNR4_9BACT|nr:sulfatase [Pontiella sulfatireligans]SPS74474.1 sulfatase S1_8 [Kiritimatiellales bacterium]VGO21920.1 Choline-sulfatase [Pontiella sulfatireligans]
MKKRPNIIYINSHDTGRYIAPYGHPVPTPNIQRFAKESVMFRQAHCVNPTCSPSRAGLLTGQYAHTNGMTGLAHLGGHLFDHTKLLTNTLGKQRYRCFLSGFQHLVHEEENSDWLDQLHHEKHLAPTLKADTGAVEFLNTRPEEPFFLEIGFFETHREFPVLGKEDEPDYTMPPALFPDTPECRKDFARYKASSRIFDQRVKNVMDALDRNGLRDNTIVILTTDHGIPFPDMKCNLTDHGTGVMLMMRWPDGFPGGRVTDALVSQVDIYPTLCDLLGINPPDWLQGESFAPLLLGETDEHRDEIFIETNYHVSYVPMRGVRTRRWKYIRRFFSQRPADCDDGETKTEWLAAGWEDLDREEHQLYDLMLDPMEKRNLAADKKVAPILLEMQQRLAAWMKETDDPLLYGDVPHPKERKSLYV